MRIKETCEDFVVDEILDETLFSEASTAYHLYLLKKTNYTTERAVQQIAKSLRIPRKIIGYAGAKDKQAITTQYITIKGVKREKIAALEIKDMELTFKGYVTQQLTLGNLIGNTFTITVYEPDFIPSQIPETFGFPNYFDEQRFSNNNFAIGTAVLRKDFKVATEFIIKGDIDYGKVLSEYLETHTHDYVGALHRIPKKILLFYVHSVQSLLFNELLAKQIKDGFKVNYQHGIFVFPLDIINQATSQTIPLIGYGTTPSDKQEQVLRPHGLEHSSFIVRPFPELSLEGGDRRMFVQVTNCKIVSQEKEKIVVSFALPKGAYATIVLKQLFAMR